MRKRSTEGAFFRCIASAAPTAVQMSSIPGVSCSLHLYRAWILHEETCSSLRAVRWATRGLQVRTAVRRTSNLRRCRSVLLRSLTPNWSLVEMLVVFYGRCYHAFGFVFWYSKFLCDDIIVPWVRLPSQSSTWSACPLSVIYWFRNVGSFASHVPRVPFFSTH